jgi:hypothetical protein
VHGTERPTRDLSADVQLAAWQDQPIAQTMCRDAACVIHCDTVFSLTLQHFSPSWIDNNELLRLGH